MTGRYNKRGRGGGGDHRRGGNRRSRSRRGARNSYDTGNQKERISVESGGLVLIDQFMLANPEFVSAYSAIIDENAQRKEALINEFGGVVLSLTPGRYKILRDPYKYLIIVHPEESEIDDESKVFSAAENMSKIPVYIDTRCIAMVDRELLDDTHLLRQYQELWFSGKDKSCRDLLRDNGGSVRYGFSRGSDDLNVSVIENESIACVWPVGVKPGEVPVTAEMPEQGIQEQSASA